MTRWKPLPGTMPERERQLAVQLRRLKDRGGLSFTALAAKTSYSSSSWERYLNGKKPVPREAVEELARVCGTDATRLLVLHETARATAPEASDAPDAPATPAGGAPYPRPLPVKGVPAARAATMLLPRPKVHRAQPADEPAPPRTGSCRHLLLTAALVAAAFGAGLLAGAHLFGAEEPWAAAEYQVGRRYSCEQIRHEGRWYAGHSTTREALLDLDSSGWEVVEAQCLLTRHGYTAGEADGLYGGGTQRAVRAFQKDRGLVADGIVGPDTWGELRR
ncbi:peptidoglycan-binding protein [Streptomyces sp. TRM66268-LWL]|uniref:Peptidoglycan-binding protein n=1 Tax=Streptomyces polyasparticus TaxID=2767826 RepID=A0ABR7SJ07_9ACTN|nr:peptidoglycan-binding protein [Streptomyces polyasparticus]MBC9715428.1 peptidoglycan-binding protein [Streptomyces polyasparticus]